MFAITFDLGYHDTSANHPKSVTQAYKDVRNTLAQFGFHAVQGSVYTTETEDLVNLFSAITALKSLTWFPASVKDIRAFKIEQWSDFTAMIKQP